MNTPALIATIAALALAAAGASGILAAGGGPTRGTASGFEITRTMSRLAMWHRSVQTRPITRIWPWTRPSAMGVILGRVRWIAGLWRGVYASLEDVILVLGPPRSWKTALIGWHVARAPGAVVATSTKPDLHDLTAHHRHGPILVLNPEQLGIGLFTNLRWDPLVGCEQPRQAFLRAGYLIAGAADRGTKDRKFWEGNAHTVLRCLLLAAALGGHDMQTVFEWSHDFRNQMPVSILERDDAPPNWATELRQIQELPDRTRESIAITLAGALRFMADPHLAAVVNNGHGLDAAAFIRARGTLYLIGSDHEHSPLSPLFSALCGHIVETAKLIAGGSRKGRLDPPLRFVLDEAALICRLPLERLSSDAGGRGITLIATIQGRSQLDDGWGESAAKTIWNNSTVKVALGGITDNDCLHDLSELAGERFNVLNEQVERVPVLRPVDIRELGEGQALVLHRTSRAVICTITPIWQAPQPPRTDEQPTGWLAPVIRLADWRRTRQHHTSRRSAS